MKKILIGLLAVIVVATGGFFSFQFYTQQRIAAQLDAAFEQVRGSGGKASHGKVAFDLLSRTVAISDIESETATQPPVRIKLASVTASGVGEPDATHFSADHIEVAGLELDARLATPASWRISYKAPKITINGYSGPAGLRQPPTSSVIDVYRSLLEQFAEINASQVSIPSLTGSLDLSGAAAMTGDFTYSDMGIENVKGGKVATMKLADLLFNITTQQAGKSQTLAAHVANIEAHDIDSTAVAAALDPQKATDDQYHRAYGKASAGLYEFSVAAGPRLRIEGMSIDEVGLRPSRLQIPAILAMMPQAGAKPDPALARELIEKVAGIYEGIRVGNAEMHGLSMDTPEGTFKLAGISYGLDGGKGDFAIDGLEANTPKGPVQVGRFALKSLDIANLMRLSAQFANPAQRPAPQQALQLLTMLGGAEVKGVVAPFKSTNKQVKIDTINLDWGQFVGSIPTKAHLIARLTTPIDASDPSQRMLVLSGLDTAAIDCDLGLAWTEGTNAFALEPGTIELGNVAKLTARAALGRVSREVFSPDDPQRAMAKAAEIEAGPVEISLHDLGGVNLLVALYARMQNVSRDAARQAIIDRIKAGSEDAVKDNAGAAAAVEALIRFVSTPGQTLNIKLTPTAKAPALQLFQLLKTDPSLALAQFKIEATTGL